MLLQALFLSVGLLAAEPAPLTPVASVDLARYLGVWHEIARFPNFFQKGCDQAQAQYSLLPDGSIEVHNTCVKPDGSPKDIVGAATVVDKVSNAKLKVTFLPKWLRWTGIGSGDYWVVDLASDYRYAVVSEPGRKYLWILSRTPVMERKDYQAVLDRMAVLGLDAGRLMASKPGNVKP
jgi:apolipoprotein D and lipocalin family protein